MSLHSQHFFDLFSLTEVQRNQNKVHSRYRVLGISVENLVPIVIDKLKASQLPVIYGTDYPTPDGTCIRDYVDVRDIARAHLATADSTATLPLAMNVGTGRGGSVREVIKLVCAAAGKSEVVAEEKNRRAGDPAFLCADVSLIKNEIGFVSKYSLEASTESLSNYGTKFNSAYLV